MSGRKVRKDRLDDGVQKTCKECGEIKPVSEFYCNSNSSGYRPRCKACYQLDSSRRRKERGYKTSPEARDRARRGWEERNPEWRKEYQLRYQRENRDRLNARRRANYANDPSMVKRYVHKRRALLAGAEGSFTSDEWNALVESCEGRCLACGSDENLTPDHVVPLSKGGSNWIENIQPLCRSCNAKKHVETTDYRANDVCEIKLPV